MTTANKACMCQRCGHRIEKGEPIQFEKYQRMARPKWGSGRRGSGGSIAYRPVHDYDCNTVKEEKK